MLFRHDGAALAPPESSAESATPRGLVVERPPPGLARGKYPTSALSIAALGSLLLLGSLLYYFFRLRKRRP
jgi:hypothetical protein